MKRSRPSKKFKNFSELHGSKSDVFKPVSDQQLGHDPQMPINPSPRGGSPLINPGEAGHPINPGELGQSMNYPSGEDFY